MHLIGFQSSDPPLPLHKVVWSTALTGYSLVMSYNCNMLLLFPQGKAEQMEYPVYCQLFIGLLLVSTVSCVPFAALNAFYQKRKQDKERKSHALTTLSA